MDSRKGVILREGLVSVMNVNDLPAVETALRIREEAGGTVDVFSMGPMQAQDAIREAYAMGADHGYLLSDVCFSGADVLATSYTLAQGIQMIGGYDLIICGKQTTDGDTGQVGGAISQWIQIPYAGGVNGIVSLGSGSLTVSQFLDTEMMTVSVPTPCVLSVDRSISKPRMPSLKGRIDARKKEISILTLSDLEDKDEHHYGQDGSATKVEKIYPPERTAKEDVMCLNTDEAVKKIMEIISAAKKIG